MSSDVRFSRDNNRAGALWMVAAMAVFAVEDALIKQVSDAVSVGQIMLTFGCGGLVLFGGWALGRGDSLLPREMRSAPMYWRMGLEVGGRLFYALAVVLTPLSSTTVILQATPIVVVAGAALFFQEQVGVRRWSAIFIGLLGVLVVIRPGGDSFSALSLFAVLGMLGFAGRDLASRTAPAAISTAILGVYGFVAILVAGLLLLLWTGADFVLPSVLSWTYLGGIVLAGSAGYAALMRAMRTGEVSAVAPFRYARLLFGLLFGVLMFGEQIDGHTLVGCGLIVVAGIWLMARSRQATR